MECPMDRTINLQLKVTQLIMVEWVEVIIKIMVVTLKNLIKI